MTDSKRPLRVFLSYASQDRPAVRELYQRLKAEGWIDPWLDEENLTLGQHWTSVIEDALDTADVVLIFLSKNSVQKEGFIQRELNYAWEISLEKPRNVIFLIPFRLDDCEVPRYLRSKQWGDYFGEKKESTYQTLLRSLRARHQQKLYLEAEERARTEELAHGQAEEAARLEEEKRKQYAIEKAAREKAEREENEKTEREKAEKEAAEKTASEKAKHQAARKAALLSTISQFVTALKSALQKSIPVLRIMGIFGIIAILFWGGSWIVPKIIEIFPTTEPGEALMVTATKFTTDVPLSPTAVSQRKPTTTPTKVKTSTSLLDEITDDFGVEMVYVPAGEFVARTYTSSKTVDMDAFYIDKYEVTNASYKDCIDAGKCLGPTDSKLGAVNYFSNDKYADYPVVWVTREYAEQYCNWRGSRIPSDEEWQKAASGTDQRSYPWGNQTDDITLRANGPGIEDGFEITAPVGSFPLGVSPYGAYDMAGNVSEYISNDYVSTSTGSEGRLLPLTKGGDWYEEHNFFHGFLVYLSQHEYVANSWTGFRCVRDVNP